MQLHDYSNLLNVIDELDLEKVRLTNTIEANEKTELARLEKELLNSGMLKDWHDLVEVLTRAKVRGCPYPNMLPGTAQFMDNYTFTYHVNSRSSGYRQDYHGIKPNGISNTISYVTWSNGYGSEEKVDIFAAYGHDPVMRKVRVETTLIKDFMNAYPLYKEIKLKEVYAKIDKKRRDNEALKERV